jgi:sigma-B regulation protein RsbU (phosphoserine phosphatase)
VASDLDPAAELLVPGLAALLDHIDQAVIVQDSVGRIQLLNAAARLLFPDADIGDLNFGDLNLGDLNLGDLNLGDLNLGDLNLGDEFKHAGESFVADAGGRPVRGRLQRLGDGWQAWVVSATSRRATANENPTTLADQHDFMLAASLELTVGVGHEAAAGVLARLAVPTVGEQAAVLLPAPRARMSWWRCADGVAELAQGMARAPASRTAPVLASMLRGTTVNTATATVPVGELPALAAVFGIDLAEGKPVMAVPLRGSDRTEGLLVVVRPVAVSLLTQLAALAGPTIGASRRRGEQASALELLQAPLMPAKPGTLPELPGVELGVAYQAAGELAVGGDFYLVRPTGDGGAIFGLGDVCGKGAEALAESGRVQHSLAALMVTEQDPTQLLYLLNRALLAAGRTVFTTMVLGVLRPAHHGYRLILATGGHPPPMVLRRSGQVEEIAVPGTVVGILPDARFGRTSIALEPGETFVLYSDGVTEAGRPSGEGQEQFGPARLAECLRACAGMSAQAVATRVEHTISSWLGRDDGDDLAVLAVRALDRGA